MHAFLWSGDQMQDLGTLGGNSSQASALNGDGVVVGGSYLADGTTFHAFLYDGAAMRDLGTLPGTKNSWPWSINSSGAVVGYATTGQTFQGFLYDGAQLWDLNQLIAPSIWTILEGRAINDAGQILASAYGLQEGRWVNRTVLLNPGLVGRRAEGGKDHPSLRHLR
jgi:probable HAF family extracellular repeat protein